MLRDNGDRRSIVHQQHVHLRWFEGATIARCSAGIDLRTDCAALATGATCFELATTSEPYCGYGNECYPTKGAETCNGTSVTFCGAGMTTTVDCTSLGFTSCFSGHCAMF
jgi:hypothetical protein